MTTTATRRVSNYATGSRLDGTPSAALIAASEAAGETGVVSAYRDAKGVWQHIDDSRVSDYERMGHEVQAVYVEAS